MRYIIEISKNIADKIKTLVEQGKYGSLHDFLLVAVENQLFIESHELDLEKKPAPTRGFHEVGSIEGKKLRTIQPLDLPELRTDWVNPPKQVEPPDLENLWSKYLWGQYNRLFPTKIALRVLANLLKNQRKIPLAILQEKASSIATEVGIYLGRVDRKTRKKRWEAFSVGLPKSRRNIGGISRFKLQFVGYLTKSGILHGMPAALRFLNITKQKQEKTPMVGITKAGTEFAKLRNPIIDSKSFEATLSDEEVAYYVSHAQSHQPYEMKAIETAIKAVEDGHVTFQEIRTQIGSLDESWSSNVLTTMCTGVLSRMRELRILRMEREGLKSIYEVGPNSKMVRTR